MPTEHDTTRLVRRLREGDETARSELINYAYERLRRRSRVMLRGYCDLREVEQTDDVLQNALLLLHREFQKGKPLESALHFWNTATLLIRRSLLELARKYRGRHGRRPREVAGQGGEAGPIQQCVDAGDEPGSLEGWTEFHEQIENLPEREKEIFGLRWYGGLSHGEAAAVLGVSEREVKRRWQSARCLLSQRLNGSSPE